MFSKFPACTCFRSIKLTPSKTTRERPRTRPTRCDPTGWLTRLEKCSFHFLSCLLICICFFWSLLISIHLRPVLIISFISVFTLISNDAARWLPEQARTAASLQASKPPSIQASKPPSLQASQPPSLQASKPQGASAGDAKRKQFLTISCDFLRFLQPLLKISDDVLRFLKISYELSSYFLRFLTNFCDFLRFLTISCGFLGAGGMRPQALQY